MTGYLRELYNRVMTGYLRELYNRVRELYDRVPKQEVAEVESSDFRD